MVGLETSRGEIMTLNRLPGLVRLPARVDRWMSRLLDAMKKTLAVQTKDVRLTVLSLSRFRRKHKLFCRLTTCTKGDQSMSSAVGN